MKNRDILPQPEGWGFQLFSRLLPSRESVSLETRRGCNIRVQQGDPASERQVDCLCRRVSCEASNAGPMSHADWSYSNQYIFRCVAAQSGYSGAEASETKKSGEQNKPFGFHPHRERWGLPAEEVKLGRTNFTESIAGRCSFNGDTVYHVFPSVSQAHAESCLDSLLVFQSHSHRVRLHHHTQVTTELFQCQPEQP